MSNPSTQASSTDLRARGYATLPVPRHVELHEDAVRLNAGWAVALYGVGTDDIAVRTLRATLADEHHMELTGSGRGARTLHLSVEKGAVKSEAAPECDV